VQVTDNKEERRKNLGTAKVGTWERNDIMGLTNYKWDGEGWRTGGKLKHRKNEKGNHEKKHVQLLKKYESDTREKVEEELAKNVRHTVFAPNFGRKEALGNGNKKTVLLLQTYQKFPRYNCLTI